MPITVVENRKVWQQRDRLSTFKYWLGWLLGTLLFVYCAQIIASATTWAFVWDAPDQGAALLARMLPPRWAYTGQIIQPLWDTLNIATLGTLIGVAIALPTAFFAAHNTTPHPIFRHLALLIIVTSRSINSLIWALLLVAIFGPGVLAGVIAIGLRSAGFIGKLFYEAIEEIDPKPVEAITATGAGPLQILTYGIIPQVLPAFVGVGVFRWDINIRESTVLGLVGAGGIGIALSASVNGLRWSQVSIIFIAIFIMVFISESISAAVRKRII